VEWIVGALVVLGFIAIAVRFVPRDAAGRARLPRMVEESIGMWAVRRLTGQADTNRQDSGDRDGPATPVDREPRPEPASRFDAAPIGPAPIAPTVFVPSGSPTQARPMGDIGAGSARRPVTSPIIELKVLRRRPRPSANVAMERRLVVLAALLVVGLIVLGIVLAPRSPRGEVLGATGSPNLLVPPGDGSSEPEALSGSEASAAAATKAPGSAATREPTPAATPRATPRPTPAPTTRPIARPTAHPTPAPTATSTPAPTATPTPAPPIASITCTTSSLTVTCDGSNSDREVSYRFDFDGGPSGTPGPDPSASYTYSVGGTYTITLTVADAFGRTSTDSATVTVP
jgi:PKD domain